jgi:hypothetical protein
LTQSGHNPTHIAFDTTFTNPVTINIAVGYGEVHGDPVGGLGATSLFNIVGPSVTYTQLLNALVSEGAPGVGSLPSSAPTGLTLGMTRAEEKALGLFTDNSSTIGGYIGFSNTALFNYDPNNRAAAGYDFVGTVEHEISEVMGRASGLSFSGFYGPIDLFRYAAPGTPQLTTGSPSYFSLDSGTTPLKFWNNFTTGDPAGDLGDWAPGTPDAFLASATPGVTNSVTPTDILLMRSIGWTTSPAIHVTNVFVAENSPIPASSLITSVSNPNGDLLDGYAFWDGGTGNGHFVVNGTVQPDGQWIVVSDLSSIQYVGGSSPGSETLYAEVHDATTQTWSNFSSLTATTTLGATFPFTGDAMSQIETIYIGYFGRAGDPVGTTYWINQLLNGGSTVQSMTGIAASYSVQPESQAQYPFLANPLSATTSGAGNQLDQFINSVYQNLFGRVADGTDTSGGLGYWRGQILNVLATHDATALANELGSFILQVAYGAQNTAASQDQTVLTNKVTVADFFTQALAAHNIHFGNDGSAADQAAHTDIASVTADPASVHAAEVAIVGIIPSLV